jgi:thioredoxin reductase (NADPH)
MQDRLFKNPKVEVLWNHTIEEVVGAQDPRGVEGVAPGMSRRARR